MKYTTHCHCEASGCWPRQSRLLGTVLLGLFLIGCSSTSSLKAPQVLEQVPDDTELQLESLARILVFQGLAKGVDCQKAKSSLPVTIKGGKKGGSVAVEANCTLVPGTLVMQSKGYLEKGKYQVKVGRPKDRKYFIGQSTVTTDCKDPDANVGPEQDYVGAEMLGANQVVKSKVDFANGYATHWYHVGEKKGNTTLHLLSDAPKEIRAQLFVLKNGTQHPFPIDALQPKVKKTIGPIDGQLFIRVSGVRYKGEASFSIARKDNAVAKSVNVPVIDCYAVGGESSVVLLKPNDSLKVNDRLNVSARKSKGGNIFLGACTVTSVSDSQVSCHLPMALAKDLSHYRAEVVKVSQETQI